MPLCYRQHVSKHWGGGGSRASETAAGFCGITFEMRIPPQKTLPPQATPQMCFLHAIADALGTIGVSCWSLADRQENP